MSARESSIEKTAHDDLEAAGYEDIKIGFEGWPDRLVVCPGGLVVWIEWKKPGESLRPAQVQRKKRLEKMGHEVLVLDSAANVLDEVKTRRTIVLDMLSGD